MIPSSEPWFNSVDGLWFFTVCMVHLVWLVGFRLDQNVKIEPVREISNNVVCATSKASDQPAHTRSLIRALTSRSNIL